MRDQLTIPVSAVWRDIVANTTTVSTGIVTSSVVETVPTTTGRTGSYMEEQVRTTQCED